MLVASRVSGAQEVHHRREFRQHGKNVIASRWTPPMLSAMDLEKALVPAICERTGGRIRSLHVQIFGDRVVLCGCADSYHAVQLALVGLSAAFIALDLDRPEVIELDIDVMYCGKPQPLIVRLG